MPRFVILQHDHPELHWDLLLETGAVLRAWRLESPPASGKDLDAQANFDHRLFYLDHEGPVSGNRGTVQRWDAGVFTCALQEEDRLEVTIQGQRLKGKLCLQRVQDDRWRVRYLEGS